MQVKIGNYLFVAEPVSESLYNVSICTSDNVSILDMKMSDIHISMLIGLINNIALDTQSGFVNVPLSSPRFVHTLYMNRNDYKGEIYMRVYKTDVMTSHDKHIVSITSKIESREFEQLYTHLNKLLG